MSTWIMRQTWRDLLFAHWQVPYESLRRVVPAELELDHYEGEYWIAVVPFLMTDIRARLLPPIPGINRSLELNVRTYVTHNGRAGVYFFSLDAESAPLVYGARATYKLPYFQAKMSWDGKRYESQRKSGKARLIARYQATGASFHAVPGSRESFLTDRYSLFTISRGRVLRADIHHAPWPLQPASAVWETNTMTESLGLHLSGPPLLHFSKILEVSIDRIHPAG